ncbi:MAG: molybdopterin-guanine dinucleotide biosynthesis protein MobB [Dissulfurispiraceae bacterium]|jgi:molybdopterin-guanine dinucleotide biosynthesis protein MobB
MHKPLIIGIGGAHSTVGKTTLSAAIIKHLTQHPTCFFSKKPRLGAIKYTRTELYASVIGDELIIKQKDKDTARLAAAGAEKVLWIKSPRNKLEEPLSMALSKLADLDGVVIEGNSAIEFVKPDIVIFICGESKEYTKASAITLMRQADIVIAQETASPIVGTAIRSTAKLFNLKDYPYIFDDQAIQDIISLMKIIEKNKEIERLLKERSVGGKISCSLARKIAEDLNVPYGDVGSTANQLKIKVKSCELGCF